MDKDAAKYFRTVINETIKVREENNIIRPDMINLLLEARKTPSENSSENGKQIFSISPLPNSSPY